MHPDDTIRPLRKGGNSSDGDGGGIAREDRLFPRDLIKGSENLPLQWNLFRGGLDDEVAVLKILQPVVVARRLMAPSFSSPATFPFSVPVSQDLK